MKHLCRDFLTMASASCPGTNMYLLAIFLMHCGGFSVISQTNFNLRGGTVLKGEGISGSINTVGETYEVFLPTGSYAVSDNDVGRILALKSQVNPRHNSGLFRVTSINSGTNCLTIDYRTNESPPAEQFMFWRMFENEQTASLGWMSGSNGTAGYNSWNPNNNNDLVTASCSRIMMRSDHETSWHVRMCLESVPDVSGAVPSGFSIAPGFGPGENGDFYMIPSDSGPGHSQKLFLHGAMWYNTTSSLYRGMTVGVTPLLNMSGSGPLWSNGQWRISMIVDDHSGTCAIVNKNVSLPVNASSGSGWCVFGLTQNETTVTRQSNLSDPSININRLFVVGSSNAQSNLTWDSQFHSDNNMQVVGWSKNGYPVPGVLSCYSNISNPGNTHVRYTTLASSSHWINATELLDVEVLLGTVDQTFSAGTTTQIFKRAPRRLGRLPMFMMGQVNYVPWTTTVLLSGSGGHDYYHTRNGVFMEWGGPPPTDVTTPGNYIPISSSVEDQEGLMHYGAFLPGSDPLPQVIPMNVKDIDAMRYRKTYSYYRQVPVNVGHIKGGSNTVKS